MSTGKGIHLNGDKAWLEQLLNEKFGRIEDKMENFSKQIDIHRLAIQEINKDHDDCRESMQQQIWTLLGKEQGMNQLHKTDMEKKDFSFRRWGIYIAVGNIVVAAILNVAFFILRNIFFYK